MSKPIYVHMCFVCARDQDSVIYGEKPFVQIPVNNEAEFKAWLGQALCAMWDIYKSAATAPEVGDLEQVDMALVQMLANPVFLELRSWVSAQKRLADKALTIRLGKAYGDIISRLEEHNITLMQDVTLKLDMEIGDFDKVVVVNEG